MERRSGRLDRARLGRPLSYPRRRTAGRPCAGRTDSAGGRDRERPRAHRPVRRYRRRVRRPAQVRRRRPVQLLLLARTEDQRDGAQQFVAARRAAAAAAGAGRFQRRRRAVRARIKPGSGAAQDRRADHLDADAQRHRQLAGRRRPASARHSQRFPHPAAQAAQGVRRRPGVCRPGERRSRARAEQARRLPSVSGSLRLLRSGQGKYQTLEAQPPMLHITGAPMAAPQPQTAAAAPAAPAPAAAHADAQANAPIAGAAQLLPRDAKSGHAIGFAPLGAPHSCWSSPRRSP